MDGAVTGARLVAEVQACDNPVRLADPEAVVRAAWRRAIDGARRENLVPAGMRLRHTGRDHGDLVVWLESAQREPSARPEPVVVPDEVPVEHPLLGTAEQVAETFDIEPASVSRTRCVLHALVDAAQERGYTVTLAAASTLVFERDGEVEIVRCIEEREHREVVPTADELGDDAPRYPWQRVATERRLVATGRLCLEVGDQWHRRGRRSRWADRRRWRVEDNLAEVLAEVESRTDAARDQRRAAQDRAQREEAEWREAMTLARQEFDEQRHRDEVLRQVDAWTLAGRVRAYSRALVDAAESGEHAAAPEDVEAWAAWARNYADSIDPLALGSLAPEPLEPSPEQLRPYLRGRSPHGPDRS